jgi:hypothetical protein
VDTEGGKSVFPSVLVRIDGSPEALEAAAQASALAEGRLEHLAAYDIAAGLVGGTALGECPKLRAVRVSSSRR